MKNFSVLSAIASFTIAYTATNSPARSEMTCTDVSSPSITQPKYLTEIRWAGLETEYDKDVERLCSQGWKDAKENWLYGSYYFLYSNWNDFYKNKQYRQTAANAAKKESGSYLNSIKRYVCTEKEGFKQKKVRITGFYAVSSRTISKSNRVDDELTFLCVNPKVRGRSIGTYMLDAVRKDYKGNLSILSLNKESSSFYGRYEMQCIRNTHEGKQQDIFTLPSGNPLTLRKILFDNNSISRIDYGCTSNGEYENFVNLGDLIVSFNGSLYLQDATDQPPKGKIEAKDARKLLCDTANGFNLNAAQKSDVQSWCKSD